MKRRIFIAINFPEKIKKELVNYQAKWPELPCRWTKEENLHITLAFLGYLSNEEVSEVLKITKELVNRHRSFSINLKKIIYGPSKNLARMIWAEGEKSNELSKLQNDLENSLLFTEALVKQDIKENRTYAPHITLGRINQWEFGQIEIEKRPIIDEDIFLSFEVNSIEIMESQLKHSGAEYIILESAQLKS